MKVIVAMLTLAISANVFAYSSVDSSAVTTALPIISTAATSGGDQKVQAAVVLNDAQEFMQSGKASPFLSQKIKEAQEVNADASESDALEMLINEAQSILK